MALRVGSLGPVFTDTRVGDRASGSTPTGNLRGGASVLAPMWTQEGSEVSGLTSMDKLRSRASEPVPAEEPGNEESGSRTESGSETGTESGAETGTESGAETESGSETGSETGTEFGSETGTESGSETESGTGAESVTGAESGNEVESG